MPGRGPLPTTVTIVLALVAGVGCGTDEAATPTAPAATALSEEERSALTRYDRQISRHCVRVTASFTDPGAAPTPGQEARAFAAADALVDLAASKPLAPLEAGGDTRLFLSDVIENLEGSNCDPRMLAVLGSGLAEITTGP